MGKNFRRIFWIEMTVTYLIHLETPVILLVIDEPMELVAVLRKIKIDTLENAEQKGEQYPE